MLINRHRFSFLFYIPLDSHSTMCNVYIYGHLMLNDQSEKIKSDVVKKLSFIDKLTFASLSKENEKLVSRIGVLPKVVDILIRAESVVIDDSSAFYVENYFIVISTEEDKMVIEGDQLYHLHSGARYQLPYKFLPHFFSMVNEIGHLRFELGRLDIDYVDSSLRDRLWKEYMKNTKSDLQEILPAGQHRVLQDISKCVQNGTSLRHCTFVAESFELIKHFFNVSNTFTMENLHINVPDMPESLNFFNTPRFQNLSSAELFKSPLFSIDLFWAKKFDKISLHTTLPEFFDAFAEVFIEEFALRDRFFGQLVFIQHATRDEKDRIRNRIEKIRGIKSIDSSEEFEAYSQIVDPNAYGHQTEFQYGFCSLSHLNKEWRADPIATPIPDSEFAPRYAARHAKFYKWKINDKKEAACGFFDCFIHRSYAGVLVFLVAVFDCQVNKN
ncbi:unnamed protein product, partial [Mesorhabditis belari]|uniref:Uncharacterized protein n=1 Tax=Mesorhabditis belari TaxID=2138241 RepID=A0AAF3EXH8_9BILA